MAGLNYAQNTHHHRIVNTSGATLEAQKKLASATSIANYLGPNQPIPAGVSAVFDKAAFLGLGLLRPGVINFLEKMIRVFGLPSESDSGDRAISDLVGGVQNHLASNPHLAWDQFLYEGVLHTMHLDEVFAVVAFTLDHYERVDPSKKYWETFLHLIKDMNAARPFCSTGCRHELVQALAAAGIPGIHVFSDVTKFVQERMGVHYFELLNGYFDRNPKDYAQFVYDWISLGGWDSIKSKYPKIRTDLSHDLLHFLRTDLEEAGLKEADISPEGRAAHDGLRKFCIPDSIDALVEDLDAYADPSGKPGSLSSLMQFKKDYPTQVTYLKKMLADLLKVTTHDDLVRIEQRCQSAFLVFTVKHSCEESLAVISDKQFAQLYPQLKQLVKKGFEDAAALTVLEAEKLQSLLAQITPFLTRQKAGHYEFIRDAFALFKSNKADSDFSTLLKGVEKLFKATQGVVTDNYLKANLKPEDGAITLSVDVVSAILSHALVADRRNWSELFEASLVAVCDFIKSGFDKPGYVASALIKDSYTAELMALLDRRIKGEEPHQSIEASRLLQLYYVYQPEPQSATSCLKLLSLLQRSLNEPYKVCAYLIHQPNFSTDLTTPLQLTKLLELFFQFNPVGDKGKQLLEEMFKLARVQDILMVPENWPSLEAQLISFSLEKRSRILPFLLEVAPTVKAFMRVMGYANLKDPKQAKLCENRLRLVYFEDAFAQVNFIGIYLSLIKPLTNPQPVITSIKNLIFSALFGDAMHKAIFDNTNPMNFRKFLSILLIHVKACYVKRLLADSDILMRLKMVFLSAMHPVEIRLLDHLWLASNVKAITPETTFEEKSEHLERYMPPLELFQPTELEPELSPAFASELQAFCYAVIFSWWSKSPFRRINASLNIQLNDWFIKSTLQQQDYFYRFLSRFAPDTFCDISWANPFLLTTSRVSDLIKEQLRFVLSPATQSKTLASQHVVSRYSAIANDALSIAGIVKVRSDVSLDTGSNYLLYSLLNAFTVTSQVFECLFKFPTFFSEIIQIVSTKTDEFILVLWMRRCLSDPSHALTFEQFTLFYEVLDRLNLKTSLEELFKLQSNAGSFCDNGVAVLNAYRLFTVKYGHPPLSLRSLSFLRNFPVAGLSFESYLTVFRELRQSFFWIDMGVRPEMKRSRTLLFMSLFQNGRLQVALYDAYLTDSGGLPLGPTNDAFWSDRIIRIVSRLKTITALFREPLRESDLNKMLDKVDLALERFVTTQENRVKGRLVAVEAAQNARNAHLFAGAVAAAQPQVDLADEGMLDA